MKIDLKKITQNLDKKALPPPPVELLKKIQGHYAGTLEKYGYEVCRNVGLPHYFAKYFISTDEKYKSLYRPEARGLFLLGNPGTGKTLALEIFSGLFEIEFLTASEIGRVFAVDGEADVWEWMKQYKHSDIVIDELGAERDIKVFGNSGIMIDVLAERYNMFRYYGSRTFFSSNFPRKTLSEIYGERIISRFEEQCIFIAVTGNDRRKTNIQTN